MVQATSFHHGQRLGAADIEEARQICPVCRSSEPREPVFRVQRDPDIDMLACATCGAASASHMPKPEVLASYYAQYYSGAALRHTLDKPERFARHALRAMPDLRGPKPLRILDFGGGDGSLAIAIAKLLRSQGNSELIAIDVVDYSEPRPEEDRRIRIDAHRELATVEGGHDLILASAIFEHIPDAHTAIREVLSCAGRSAYMYARTPYVLPLARIVRSIDITYPGHVHDMGSVFWGRFIETFGVKGTTLSSRPSLVETTFAHAPARTLVAHTLKSPALVEQALLGRSRRPRWGLVGGWEAVMRFE
ncbi:MAG: methyltransferase domain-containing protein [Mycobacterium sp.]|uniref:class I SAM-dependent methyltransferase n=1 Tax=Mycobacterium sp. TaxID=1785 RepID=UPI001ED5AF9A|nr:methyltransferase domain-containing protein [Mycobacterium sp.]MBW0017780.1 methyltransferase domain-containing protein [Mycobacterium sp.]